MTGVEAKGPMLREVWHSQRVVFSYIGASGGSNPRIPGCQDMERPVTGRSDRGRKGKTLSQVQTDGSERGRMSSGLNRKPMLYPLSCGATNLVTGVGISSGWAHLRRVSD